MEFTISSNIVWITFAFAIVIAIIASIILLYHWKSYGMGSPKVLKGKKIYFGGIVFFSILASIFAIILNARL